MMDYVNMFCFFLILILAVVMKYGFPIIIVGLLYIIYRSNKGDRKEEVKVSTDDNIKP